MANFETNRELFPLPFLDAPSTPRSGVSRTVQQRQHAKCRTVSWANEGIAALNRMSALGRPHRGSKLNRNQRHCLAHIFESYSQVGKPGDLDGAEALRELCAKGHGYHDDTGGSAVRPYAKDKVS